MEYNILHADALAAMKSAGDTEFKMIYLDPPFYTQTNFKDFDDKWATLDEYIAFLRPIFIKARQLLADDGALVVHCDYHASHYIKVTLDGIFSYDLFSNEFMTKRSAKNAKNQKKRLFTNEDRVLVYWKGKRGMLLYVPQKLRDKNAPKWASMTGGGAGPPMRFGEKWIMPPDGRHYMWSQEHIDLEWGRGNVKITKLGNPLYRITSNTVSVGTVWDDIPSYSNKYKYATEKHPEFATRLLNMYTAVGDWVGDFFMGSGVMGECALNMGRKYVGSDINEKAVAIASQRIDALKVGAPDASMLDV